MKFLKSRGGAVLVTVLVVALSVLFGAHRSLTRARNDALEVFTLGEGRDGRSVRADLEARRAACANLYTVAARYLEESSSELKDLSTALVQAERVQEEGELPSIDRLLEQTSAQVFAALEGAALSERDRGYVSGFQSELESRAFSISHDPYNDLALAFNNDTLGSFPANLLSRVVGVDPLPVYR